MSYTVPQWWAPMSRPVASLSAARDDSTSYSAMFPVMPSANRASVSGTAPPC